MKRHRQPSELGSEAQLHAQYLRDIAHIPPLSSTLEGGSPPRLTPEARAAVIEEHLHTVVAIAHRYRGQGVSLADLVGEGNLCLVQCAQTTTQDRQFAASLEAALHQSMQRLIATHTAEEAPLSLEALEQHPLRGQHPPAYPPPDALLIAQEACQTLQVLIAGLALRQRQTLARHYGFLGPTPHTLAAIGRELGISPSAVHNALVAARIRLHWASNTVHELLLDACTVVS